MIFFSYKLFNFFWNIVNVVTLDSNIFLWIATSVSDAAAVNPDGIKTLLANGLSSLFIRGNPGFSNGPKSLSKSLTVYPIYGIEFLITLS